jgi:Acyl-CoA dehydrogenase, C-terminal domain
MPAPCLDDTDLVNFAACPELQPYLDAAAAVAQGAAVAGSERAAAHVRGLGLAEVLTELPAGQARGLLYHAARLLAQADPAAAWLGLNDAASVLLGTGQRAPVAWPAAAPAGRWVVCLARPEDAEHTLRLHPRSHRLLGPCAASRRALVEAWADAPLLAGLPGARQCTVQLPPPADAGLRLGELAWCAHAAAQLAFLGGCLAGACQRLADEAFAYAKQRQSAGKPISQHQAVALRLADLAMAQQALGLYLEALASEGPARLSTLSLDYVVDAACGVARDALQTAAAHGYVDGLPFMRLHQQVCTLAALLCALRDPLNHTHHHPELPA